MTEDQPKPPLRILLVEDSAEDAEILLNHLKAAGRRIHARQVDSAETLSAALAEETWDLVLSDYSLPRFNGLKALELLRETGQDVPFVLVSGTIGEETAVIALKAGAHDFVTKDKLIRLLPTIDRELREADVRRQRREAEAALAELQAKLTAVSEAANDAILLVDSSYRISFWNPAAERMFGYPLDYALGQDLFDLIIAPVHRADLARLFQESLQLEPTSHGGKTTELTGRNKDGWEILLEVSLSTVLLGGHWHVVLIVRDITQRKALEQDWIEQLHFFQTVLETIPNPIYYKDADGRYLGCNSAFAAYLDIPKDEVIGKSLRDIVPPELVPPHHAVDMEILRSKAAQTYEAEAAYADGSRRTVIESKAPFFDIEGRVAGIVGTMLDITDRRRGELERAALEVQLRQAQKLEAIGQLAAGIAHEINTPTQFIGDNSVFLRDAFRDVLAFLQWQQAQLTRSRQELELPSLLADWKQRLDGLDLDYILVEIPKAIAQTLDGVARVARIVGAMKDFSHPGMEAKVHVDLNHSIESTLIISHTEWKYFAVVETDYDPQLEPVPCYPGEFNQVILNLVVNAAHAIEEAKAQGRPDLEGRIRISTRQEGREAIIRVEDNGTGIPEAIRSRVFEPFFTTKSIGKGTGQGLAIAHAVIVDKHKGRLTLESEVGKGTTFTLALPM